MHSQGVIHRDVKPENILFKNKNEDVDLALVDLGFATLEKQYRHLFVRCGTPGYVAPEILNDKDYDRKVDVYSVGVIFYMILSNKIPFPGKSYSEIVLKNMAGKVDFDLGKFGV